MPYIPQKDRDRLDEPIDRWFFRLLEGSGLFGALNYSITRMILLVWSRSTCYDTANSILGVLEAVKQEFYRRHVAPYEDQKQAANGDVRLTKADLSALVSPPAKDPFA